MGVGVTVVALVWGGCGAAPIDAATAPSWQLRAVCIDEPTNAAACERYCKEGDQGDVGFKAQRERMQACDSVCDYGTPSQCGSVIRPAIEFARKHTTEHAGFVGANEIAGHFTWMFGQTDEDVALAVTTLRFACKERESQLPCAMVAKAYQRGYGVAPDPEESAKWAGIANRLSPMDLESIPPPSRFRPLTPDDQPGAAVRRCHREQGGAEDAPGGECLAKVEPFLSDTQAPATQAGATRELDLTLRRHLGTQDGASLADVPVQNVRTARFVGLAIPGPSRARAIYMRGLVDALGSWCTKERDADCVGFYGSLSTPSEAEEVRAKAASAIATIVARVEAEEPGTTAHARIKWLVKAASVARALPKTDPARASLDAKRARVAKALVPTLRGAHSTALAQVLESTLAKDQGSLALSDRRTQLLSISIDPGSSPGCAWLAAPPPSGVKGPTATFEGTCTATQDDKTSSETYDAKERYATTTPVKVEGDEEYDERYDCSPPCSMSDQAQGRCTPGPRLWCTRKATRKKMTTVDQNVTMTRTVKATRDVLVRRVAVSVTGVLKTLGSSQAFSTDHPSSERVIVSGPEKKEPSTSADLSKKAAIAAIAEQGKKLRIAALLAEGDKHRQAARDDEAREALLEAMLLGSTDSRATSFIAEHLGITHQDLFHLSVGGTMLPPE